MVQIEKDEARENRIENEIIVDAYGEEEHALGWYYYLEGKLKFPFSAKCITKRTTSPLRVDEEVKVMGIASENVCRQEMFVKVKWDKRSLAVPLSQLKIIHADPDTKEAVEDWHYWVKMGYLF